MQKCTDAVTDAYLRAAYTQNLTSPSLVEVDISELVDVLLWISTLAWCLARGFRALARARANSTLLRTEIAV